MASYYSEHLVIHGENLEAVTATVKDYLQQASAGQSVELVESSASFLYYRSLTKMCRIACIIYELLLEAFPQNEIVLCSNLENGDGQWAVWKDGAQLFYATGYSDEDDDLAWVQMIGGEDNAKVYENLLAPALCIREISEAGQVESPYAVEVSAPEAPASGYDEEDDGAPF